MRNVLTEDEAVAIEFLKERGFIIFDKDDYLQFERAVSESGNRSCEVINKMSVIINHTQKLKLLDELIVMLDEHTNILEKRL